MINIQNANFIVLNKNVMELMQIYIADNKRKVIGILLGYSDPMVFLESKKIINHKIKLSTFIIPVYM